METKHTPLPFKSDTHGFIRDSRKLCVALVSNGFANETQRAEVGEFIVRACNNHYKLIEALKEIAGYYTSAENAEQDFALSHDTMIDLARDAIAEAEAK